MSFILVNDTEGTGALITFSGIIKPEEIFTVQTKIGAHENCPKWRYQIWDFSKADRLDFSIADLRQFAVNERIIAKVNPTQKIAIIPRRSTHKGLDEIFRIYENVWGAWESATFWDLDSARQWAQNSQQSNKQSD
jgi:hypothetical protein